MDKRIIKAKIDLMLQNPFWGSLITRLQLKDWNKDTFGTDGKYLYVPDSKYYKDFTFKELTGVLAHETFHCAGGHVFRMKDKQKERWNVAADFATNILLTKNGFQLPKGALLDNKYDGMAAEKIYALLPSQGENGQGQGKGQDQSSSGVTSKDLKEPPPPGSGKDKKDGKDDGEGSSGMDSKEMEQEWKEAITSAARIAKGRGSLPGGMEEYIDNLLFPKIPWQELLYHHLQTAKGNTDYTTYPFNRQHIWREIYLPSLRGEMIELVCYFDTSGSIGHEDLIRYFSELTGICSIFGSYIIHFMMGDTQIDFYEVLTEDSTIPKIAVGRGGTDFRPVFKKMEEEQITELPVVFFTDLDGYFPNSWPDGDKVFWIVRKGQHSREQTVPFGTIIEIDD